MEKNSSVVHREDEVIELPPGFRFHPTDEELITHYLSAKVRDGYFCAKAIGEVDLNKVEPWDLPWRAKMGEKEWYFFCVRDRKYPTGLRTNRATEAGYWKATGKDKEIYKLKQLVGMKKTLVFYKGRAPKGEKTNWVMHEYRLEGKSSMYSLHKTAKNEWVICRIFQKNSCGKKIHISGLARMSNYGHELQPSNLPPLMDCSAYDDQTRSIDGNNTSNVTCFSNPMEDRKEDMFDSFNPPLLAPSSSTKPSNISSVSLLSPKVSLQNSLFNQILPNVGNSQYADSFLMQEQSLMRLLIQNNGPKQQNSREFLPIQEMEQRGYEDPFTFAGPVDLDCLWNY